jgi:peptidoglycan/LPS O-acetylase OafA/YrhL
MTRWLGGVSFPFYLNAWIGIFALHAIEKHIANRYARYMSIASFLAGLTAAAVSYEAIDARIMEQRNRLFTTTLGWTLGTLGYCLVICGVAFWLFASTTSPLLK